MSDSTSSSGQPPIRPGNVNDNLFVNALASMWRNRTHLYNPDIALARDAAAWEKVNRCPPIAHAMMKRTHSVATRDWMIEPGGEEPQDEAAASIVEQEFRALDCLPMARLRLARAPILGNANEWLEGVRAPKTFRLPPEETEQEDEPGGADGPPDELAEEKPGAAEPKKDKPKPKGKITPEMDWWGFTNMRHIDYRRIRLVPRWERDAEGKEQLVAVEPHLGSIGQIGRWTKIEHVECLMRVVYDDEEGRLGYGRGLMEAIYWGFWIIEVLIREGLEGIKRWAQGVAIGSVNESLVGAVGKDAQSVAQAFLDALSQMQASGQFVKSKDDELQVIFPSGAGNEMILAWVDRVVDWLVQLVTGAVRPSGGGDGGTYGQGKVEERTIDEIIATDRQLVDMGITRSAIGLWWKLNAPQLAQIGLADAKMPRFVSVEGDDEDPEKFSRVADAARNKLGLALHEDDTYRRLGLKRPGPSDKTVDPPAAPALGADPFGDLAGMGGDKPKPDGK